MFSVLLLTAICNLYISLDILKLVSEIEELFVQSNGSKCALLGEASDGLCKLIYRFFEFVYYIVYSLVFYLFSDLFSCLSIYLSLLVFFPVIKA